jgi:hypothetical protein
MGKRCTYSLLVGMQICPASMEVTMEVPLKIKNKLPYDLPYHFLVYTPKNEGGLLHRYPYTQDYCSSTHNSQHVESM